MGKTEVYSWRVDPELKRSLEASARAENTSVGAVIESACRAWIERTGESADAANAELTRRRSALSDLFEAARRADPGGPPVESATNSNVRNAFKAKLAADRRRGSRRAR